MRGRLGSMSSFERVSVLEDEHENSQSFSRGTLRLLTLTPWHLKACYIPTVSSGKGQVDKNTFTFISVSRWICQQSSSHEEKRFCAAFFPTQFYDEACTDKKAEQYKKERVYRAASEPFKVVGSLVVTAVQNVE